MLTAHELFGFMSPALSGEILSFTHDNDRELYKAVLGSIAEARKLRPQFFERKPRAERDLEMIAYLSKPRLDLIAQNLLRNWLVKKHRAMLIDFLDALGVPHKDGTVEDLPETMEDAKLKAAVEQLLAKHPREEVAVYLNAFYSMNAIYWPGLKAMLTDEPRLQFGA
jgi:hypothetical protein